MAKLFDEAPDDLQVRTYSVDNFLGGCLDVNIIS